MQRSSPQRKYHRPASLRASGGARTVLLRMAADQERADRIRALKQGRPDLTWRRIADHVGVTERSATDWQTKGGITYENAEKLAAIFEVEVDYIWRGSPTEERAPSPFAGQDALADELAAIRAEIQSLRRERSQEAADIRALLEIQNTILKDLAGSVEREKRAKAEAETARTRLLEAAEAASRAYEDAARRLAEAPGTQAT